MPSGKKSALIVLTLLPVVVVSGILYREMTTIPLLDDYNAILAFLLHLQKLPTFGDKLLYIVTAQHNDYKLIFEHMVVAVQFSLMHYSSFGFLIIFGNLFLFLLLIIYWNQYFANGYDLLRRLVLFLPISYLIFQLNFAEMINWAMSGLQNLAVVIFSLASILFLTRSSSSRKTFAMACFCMALACMTSANGFLLAPIGMLIFFQQRNYKKMVVWSVLTPILLAMYFYQYVRIEGASTSPLYAKALFFLSFLGGGIENMHHFPIKYASVILGAIILFTFGHSIRTRYDLAHPFAFYSAMWIFLTAALVADVRSSYGIAQSLSGRYKLYCDLLLVFCYGYAVHRFTIRPAASRMGRRLYAVTLASVILFSAASDVVGYKFLVRRRERLEAGVKFYRANPAGNSPMLSPDDRPLKDFGDLPEMMRIQLNQAIERGIYTLPPPR